MASAELLQTPGPPALRGTRKQAPTPAWKTPLVLTIDTEPDDAWSDHRGGKLDNIRELHRLQELLSEFGAVATLMVTWKVVEDAACIDLLTKLKDRHGAEIGTHLHPWETPPFMPNGLDAGHASFPHEIPPDYFESKLACLTERIGALFGPPRAYRAGRWGVAGAHLPILERCGYSVDTSVVPLSDWRCTIGIPRSFGGAGGADFRCAPLCPYHPSCNDISRPGSAAILEIPVTAAHTRVVPGFVRDVHARLPDLARRVLSRTGLLDVLAATPAEESEDRLLAMLSAVLAGRPTVINWTIHSSELMLGGSPSTRTPAALETVFQRIRSMLRFLAEHRDAQFMTLSGAATAWNSLVVRQPLVFGCGQDPNWGPAAGSEKCGAGLRPVSSETDPPGAGTVFAEETGRRPAPQETGRRPAPQNSSRTRTRSPAATREAMVDEPLASAGTHASQAKIAAQSRCIQVQPRTSSAASAPLMADSAAVPMGYILAASHSGSTLLAMLLGAHADICTVGELKITNIGDPAAYRCSCGELIRECSFWRGVTAEMQRRGVPFDVGSAHTDYRAVEGWYAQRLLRPLHAGPWLEQVRDAALRLSGRWRRDYPLIQARNAALVRSVLQISGKRVVVDSSKVALRLKYLQRNPELDVRVVRTIRDGRAVVLTYVDPYNFADARDPARRGGGSGKRYGPQAMSVEEAAYLWRRSNEEAEAAIASTPADRVIQVRYEQLCADPKGTLQRVVSFLGVDPARLNLDFRAVQQHVIGNGMRHDRSSEIRLDERWRSVLTNQDLRVFDRVAGEMNRRNGYQ
ncbi:MAG: sulfotransferase [Planctomycetes bacterium]|nr:sulfotransferase [Planctomycetota bacterium]